MAPRLVPDVCLFLLFGQSHEPLEEQKTRRARGALWVLGHGRSRVKKSSLGQNDVVVALNDAAVFALHQMNVAPADFINRQTIIHV